MPGVNPQRWWGAACPGATRGSTPGNGNPKARSHQKKLANFWHVKMEKNLQFKFSFFFATFPKKSEPSFLVQSSSQNRAERALGWNFPVFFMKEKTVKEEKRFRAQRLLSACPILKCPMWKKETPSSNPAIPPRFWITVGATGFGQSCKWKEEESFFQKNAFPWVRHLFLKNEVFLLLNSCRQKLSEAKF